MLQIINLRQVGLNPTENYDNTRSSEKLNIVYYEESSHVVLEELIKYF